MTNSERQNILEQACSLVLTVRNSFSNQVNKCDCCGAERFENWNDRQIRELLNGAISRIEKVAGRMELIQDGSHRKFQQNDKEVD